MIKLYKSIIGQATKESLKGVNKKYLDMLFRISIIYLETKNNEILENLLYIIGIAKEDFKGNRFPFIFSLYDLPHIPVSVLLKYVDLPVVINVS